MQGLAKTTPNIPTPGVTRCWCRARAVTAHVGDPLERDLRGAPAGRWPDRASVGIPALYVNTGLILADALESLGDRPGAAAVMRRTEQVARAARIDEFFNFAAQPSLPLPGATGDSPNVLPVPRSAPVTPPPVRKESGGT